MKANEILIKQHREMEPLFEPFENIPIEEAKHQFFTRVAVERDRFIDNLFAAIA